MKITMSKIYKFNSNRKLRKNKSKYKKPDLELRKGHKEKGSKDILNLPPPLYSTGKAWTQQR